MNTQTIPQTPRLLTVSEVADILGVSTRWCYRKAKEGELPFAHLSDSPRSPLRAEVAAIDRWIADVFEKSRQPTDGPSTEMA